MDYNKVSNVYNNLLIKNLNKNFSFNNNNNNNNNYNNNDNISNKNLKDKIELTEELICDFKIINIQEILKINKDLLKEKVKRNQLLDFKVNNEDNIDNCGVGVGGVNNYFELIFNNFKDEIMDIEFYKNLFKNYSKYFLPSILYTVNYLLRSDCVVGLIVLIDHFSFRVPINLYPKSIEFGSINISNYLVKEYKCKLTLEEQNNIWSILLNKPYKNEIILNNLNKSFHYLASINTILPTIPLKFVIDFPIKSKSLDFIIDTCFSISYIINSFKSSQIIYTSKDSTETQIKLLSIIEIEQIKNKFSNIELETLVEDLDASKYSIKLLVKMACYFTSSMYKDENFTFYNLKFENKFDIQNYTEHQLIESSILSCNYGILSKLYEFHLNEDDRNCIQENSLCLNIPNEYITNDPKQIFRYSLPLSNDLKRQKMFIECSINDYCNNKLNSNRKFPIKHLIKIVLLFNKSTLVEYMLDLIIKFKPIIPKIKNKIIISWIQSTEVFDLLFQQKQEPLIIKDFKFKHLLLPRKDMNLIDPNQHVFNKNKIKDIEFLEKFKKDKMLNILLNHYKENYNQDYKNGILNLKVSPFMFGSSFIFNNNNNNDNFNDFKSLLIEYEFWRKHLLGEHDYKGKIIKDGPRLLSTSQFIKILMITPENQNYTCLDSIETLDWLIKNKPNDLNNQRCITNQLLLFTHSYHSGTLKETKIEFEKYHGNYFLNFILASGLIESIIKNADIESLNIIIDIFNEVKSPTSIKPPISISLSVTNLENGEKTHYYENEQNNQLKQIIKDIKLQIFKFIGSSNRADILEYLITCHSNLFSPISNYQSLFQTGFDNSFTSSWCNIEVSEYILNTLKYNCFSLSDPSNIERQFKKSKNNNSPPFTHMYEKFNSKINFKII
ncbi:hypothetical protein ACTFIZ_006864 [Dictyostelium cf. discoideum]